MTPDLVLYLVAGAVAGGFINGLSGTGTALFALGFYLVVLEPITAVAVVALMAILAGIQGLWIVRADILKQPARLLRFVLPGLAGVPIGQMLLGLIDATTLRILIAALLVLYGGYFSFRASLPAFSRPTPWLDGAVGFTGGALGGAASVSGALPSIWLSLRPWSKSETRAVLQPYNMATLGTTVTILAARGAYNDTALIALLITLPCGLIAAQVGIYVFGKLSNTGFRRLLIGLCLLMGIGILASEFL